MNYIYILYVFYKHEFNYFNGHYSNSDIIDVNQKLIVNNIDIVDLINNNFLFRKNI